jgi:hypothetical protein
MRPWLVCSCHEGDDADIRLWNAVFVNGEDRHGSALGDLRLPLTLVPLRQVFPNAIPSRLVGAWPILLPRCR